MISLCFTVDTALTSPCDEFQKVREEEMKWCKGEIGTGCKSDIISSGESTREMTEAHAINRENLACTFLAATTSRPSAFGEEVIRKRFSAAAQRHARSQTRPWTREIDQKEGRL